jgi:hypothetical protein
VLTTSSSPRRVGHGGVGLLLEPAGTFLDDARTVYLMKGARAGLV